MQPGYRKHEYDKSIEKLYHGQFLLEGTMSEIYGSYTKWPIWADYLEPTPYPYTIGRSPDNQMVVNDPRVSSHHAQIRPEGQGYDIIDVGSSNGTFVNEQRLVPNVPRLLYTGDQIRIGDTKFFYEAGAMSQPSIESTVYGGFSQGSNPS
jgi:FHA domain